MITRCFRLLLPLVMLSCSDCFSQTDAEQKTQDQYNQLRSQIESRIFRFHALSATSMKGMTRQLTSDYFLKLNKENLSVNLPYYGRSFTTNYPPTDISTEFKTTQFTYKS